MYLFQIYLVTMETFECKEAGVRCQAVAYTTHDQLEKEAIPHDVHEQRFQDSNELDRCTFMSRSVKSLCGRGQAQNLSRSFFAKKRLVSHSSEMMRETSLVFFFFLPFLSTCKT